MTDASLILGPEKRVVIVGGGFAGTMQAINLLRHDGPRPIMIERRPERMARGVAYSAALPGHVLNVRAANMSALPDRPDHFCRWLERRGLGGGGSFAARRLYGEYLRELLHEAAAGAGDRLRLLSGEAIDIAVRSDGVTVRLRDGGTIAADVAVLALGNLPPHDPPGFAAATLDADLYATDPWAEDVAGGLRDEDSVLLLGTGLTAVDAALLLDARGFTGRMIALSRRGLMPRAHRDRPRDPRNILERPAASLSAMARFLRRRAAERGWRDAVDDLRPVTQILWSTMAEAERARFLRHARPYWDVHRHRLAPEVAARIAALRDSGRLSIVAGKTLAARADGDGLRLTWRPRGSDAAREDRFRRAINCTGPQGDLTRSAEPLLCALRAAGRVRPDPLRLGIDVDPQCRLIGTDGTPQERLLAIGPMTRSGFWEVVAVPDIRQQCWMLARRLSNQHWVGGEGL